MLAGDIDPWMFHQANLRAYDGTHTLFTDLADRLLAQYQALRVLPIISLSMTEIAARMQDRAALRSAGLVATIGPGPTITLRATSAVRVPVTGARASNAETYGQTIISMVDVPAGGQVSLPLVTTAPATDGGTTPSSAPPSPGDGAATGAAALTTTPSSGGGCGCVAAGGAHASRPKGWWGAALVALLGAARGARPRQRRARVASRPHSGWGAPGRPPVPLRPGARSPAPAAPAADCRPDRPITFSGGAPILQSRPFFFAQSHLSGAGATRRRASRSGPRAVPSAPGAHSWSRRSRT